MKNDPLKQADPHGEGKVISVKDTFAQLSSTQKRDDLTGSRLGVVDVTQMVRAVSLKEALYSSSDRQVPPRDKRAQGTASEHYLMPAPWDDFWKH
ncbi:MAG: hypothetical protein HY909_18615 [Deltaproteobacteria bacterium]|nr:hypothetical protein [Deltaproteobacteria bacterium]